MEILGWLANGLFFYGGVLKNPRHTLMTCLIADILYVSVYLHINLYLGAIVMAITALRTGLSITLSNRMNFYSLIFFTTGLCLILTLRAESIYDILLLFATICIGCASYFRENFIF